MFNVSIAILFCFNLIGRKGNTFRRHKQTNYNFFNVKANNLLFLSHLYTQNCKKCANIRTEVVHFRHS